MQINGLTLSQVTKLSDACNSPFVTLEVMPIDEENDIYNLQLAFNKSECMLSVREYDGEVDIMITPCAGAYKNYAGNGKDIKQVYLNLYSLDYNNIILY